MRLRFAGGGNLERVSPGKTQDAVTSDTGTHKLMLISSEKKAIEGAGLNCLAQCEVRVNHLQERGCFPLQSGALATEY